METTAVTKIKEKCTSNNTNASSMSCLYGMGMFGAAIYFLSSATSFGMGAMGVLKSIVWPAVLVYEVFSKLGL
ncbi:hypothetical protein [Flavicella marina]|uniref:hypothetical protein n=1 Tax=Flavicella marina TaxID=1475951 RepID=UPI001264A087|nr:hypothetical protein [Flavicella marina]